MAYGTAAGVTFLIGGVDTEFYTTTNIALAIGWSDTVVDHYNSNAPAATKILVSNEVAAWYMKKARAEKQMKGLSSDGGGQGKPAKTAPNRENIPKYLVRMLNAGEYRGPKYSYSQKDAAGDDI